MGAAHCADLVDCLNLTRGLSHNLAFRQFEPQSCPFVQRVLARADYNAIVRVNWLSADRVDFPVNQSISASERSPARSR